MEEKLPGTTLIIETFAVGIVSLILVRTSTGLLQYIAPVAIVVILFAIFTKKKPQPFLVGFIASIAFTLYTEGNIAQFRVVQWILIGIMVLETINYATQIYKKSDTKVPPILLDATFCFFGIVLGALIRLRICPVTEVFGLSLAAKDANLLSFIKAETIALPFCPAILDLPIAGIDPNTGAPLWHRALLELFVHPLTLACLLGAAVETLRHGSLSWSFPIFWFINLFKGIFLSFFVLGLVGWLLYFLKIISPEEIAGIKIGAIPDFVSTSQGMLTFWFTLVGIALLWSLLFGWALTRWSSR
jgi:hypothetical protein